jgi:hypothetical protein
MRSVPKSRTAVRLAVGPIAASLCLLAGCGSGVRSISDMKAGDCYNKTGSFDKGDVVSCNSPHDAELVAAHARGIAGQGASVAVGAGGTARLAECLGVPEEEADTVAAVRGLHFYYAANFDAYVMESASGKLTAAVCRRR